MVNLYTKIPRKNIETHLRVLFKLWEFFEHADSFFRKIKLNLKFLTEDDKSLNFGFIDGNSDLPQEIKCL